MASFCNVSIMTFFLLASAVFLASPGLAFQVNEQDIGLPPKPSNAQDILPPDFRKYLVECAKKLSKECGPIFYTRIFIGENNEIPTSCCQELLGRGLDCHNAVTEAVVSRPEFSNNATLYLTRSVQTWKECGLTVENISLSPSA